ncbi:hypothetical protein [Baaleninema sp.]|uniref:hypothetical protein n=1 Tax=Baaleninema sp. TaxID=3101197 RepID=UPI003D0505F0
MSGYPYSTVTRLQLKLYGLSDYQIRKILKNIKAVKSDSRFKEYPTEKVTASIQKRLYNPRIKEHTRVDLERALLFIEGGSNIVKVDFLQNLSPEQRLEFLYSQIEQLSEEEKQVRQETELVIQKARQVVGYRS